MLILEEYSNDFDNTFKYIIVAALLIGTFITVFKAYHYQQKKNKYKKDILDNTGNILKRK